MKDNKKSRYEYIVYVMILPVLTSILLFYYNQMLGAIAILSCGLLYFYLQKQLDYNEKAIQRYVDEVDLSFDSITKNLVFEMPFPIAVLNNGRDIKWHNGYFRNLFPQEDLVGVDIRNLAADFKDIDFTDKQVVQPINIPIDGKIMQFYFTSVFNEGLKTTETFLYGLDNTYDESIKQLFKDKRLVFFTVFLDNYEDLRNSTDSLNRPQVLGSIDRTITEYFKRYNGVVRKYENDRFMVVMEYQQYKKIHDNKFSILDDVRDIDFGNTINPTLSIGVGISGANPNEIYDDSRVAIDIALSRGGDQAVVKLEDNYEYFGGKSKATEKTSKVKSRVISGALKRMINSSSDVYIMGHNNPDMDSFGSSLGVYEGVNFLGKDAYIVLNEVPRQIENMYSSATSSLEELSEHILTEDQALARIKPSSLVVVCDNHRKHSTEAPSLIEKTDQIFIIDHHRRGNDYIKKATISYIEPYASSASELVTEILNYLDEDFKARTSIAESLLAGITVDTKNFVYQTGVRTFEAASILKRWGADTVYIKRMFKDDFEIIKYKSEVIADSSIVNDMIAIAHFNRDIDGSTLIASQAADDLLNIKGVKASFVLTKANNKIHISGRSLGDLSVQLILERIGGGGHLTAAATQLDMSMENAENMLKKAIIEYLREEEEDESNTNR
ncbi:MULTISPECIES: DHH family phosphoesterase [Anaerococcus]|uniref:Cyclic-di-AMP phosphodiesterase n=1 Tax=Anaerococcus nagyae TaxID=1755241 RepID=A0A3E2TI47_9FIRM|nr:MULTISPECIES: DHH family phosphoesterase [Anaerococcus]MBP2069522.1 c-di-AMP phosphodiesterase-like protein [Anaerococcus nagyae]MDU2565373.1 DHH family phosphoesterase [Anaerococcus sp.]MDU3211092.1 DHH family phosphoesterase [Anaerococcus sp.]RGB76353.1 DHH family phosphoesterase [Anaerococcus nagyae]